MTSLGDVWNPDEGSVTGISNVTAAVLFMPHPKDCPCEGKFQMRAGLVRMRLRDGMAVADPVGPVVGCPLLGGLGEVLDMLPSPVSPPTTGGGAA